MDPSRVCTADAYILFYKRQDRSSSPMIQDIPISSSLKPKQSSRESSFKKEDEIIPSTTQPPLPLPRKTLTQISSTESQDQSSPIPCPMPRTHVSRTETDITVQSVPLMKQFMNKNSISSTESNHTLNKQLISPWNRFNNSHYANDEPECNVIYRKTIS